MSRTLIDLDDAQMKALDDVAAAARRSRASLIRQAVDEFLKKERAASEEEAFGLWGCKKVDGLEFERKLRAEW